MFVDVFTNISKAYKGIELNFTGKDYKATNLTDGKSYIFNNMTKFTREHSLNNKKISLCLKKLNKTHKGWVFNTLDIRDRG